MVWTAIYSIRIDKFHTLEAVLYEPNTADMLQVNQQQATRGYSGQADYWLLDPKSWSLTRVHKRTRQAHFNPITAKLKDGCPVGPATFLED